MDHALPDIDDPDLLNALNDGKRRRRLVALRWPAALLAIAVLVAPLAAAGVTTGKPLAQPPPRSSLPRRCVVR